MKLKSRALALFLCLCLFCATGATALADTPPAAASPDAPAINSFFDTYEGFFLGDTLDELADGQKQHLKEQLTEKLKNYDPAALAKDLKPLLEESAGMTDEALESAIGAAAEARGIPMKDSQLQQLRQLCRTMEKLNSLELKEKLDGLTTSAKKLTEPQGIFGEVWQFLKTAAAWAANAFHRVVEFFKTL